MSDRTDVGGERADIGARNIALDRLQDASRALKLALEMFQKANDADAVTRMKAMITELDGFDADEGRKDSAGHELGGPIDSRYRWPAGFSRQIAIATLGGNIPASESDHMVLGRLDAHLKFHPEDGRDGARGDADPRPRTRHCAAPHSGPRARPTRPPICRHAPTLRSSTRGARSYAICSTISACALSTRRAEMFTFRDTRCSCFVDGAPLAFVVVGEPRRVSHLFSAPVAPPQHLDGARSRATLRGSVAGGAPFFFGGSMIIITISDEDRARWTAGEQHELDDLDALAVWLRSDEGATSTAARLLRRHVRVRAELATPQAMRGIA